jgi:hypothetical protein
MGLFDIFSTEPANNAATAKVQAFKKAQEKSNAAIDQGVNVGSGYYDKAMVPFQSMFERGTKGYDAYLDATGVNGADGIGRARENFMSLPGYTEGINMALDQNDRRAAARGMLGSGNTIADTTKLATDYSNQKYGDYLSALAPNIGAAQGAATGQAGVLTGQGNMFANAGVKKADNIWKSQAGIGGAQADAAMADYGASKNMWDAIMGGVNLATKFLPMPG